MAERVGRKVRLYGRVQGVFYRQWTLNQARSLGVAGWVHNARDGSVEAHLEGEESAVAEMIARMKDGPAGAHVDDLTVEEVAPEAVEGFSVRL
ncbi:MAG TPA: acylphosphatase [Sphingomicrobium sp.]|nr:acylphosphatase [Sphingomicrobium sp.]